MEVALYSLGNPIGRAIDDGAKIGVGVFDTNVARGPKSDIDVTLLVHAAACAVGVLKADRHLGNAMSEPAEREAQSPLDVSAQRLIAIDLPAANMQLHCVLLQNRSD